jgi:hypothetical protein
MAVETGDDGGGFSWDIDEHRCDGAAIHGAIIDGAEHDERPGRVEFEGKRDQDGGAGRRAQAGENTDQRTEQAADQREGQVLQAHRRRQTGHEMFERVHHAPQRPSMLIGSGTLSQ